MVVVQLCFVEDPIALKTDTSNWTRCRYFFGFPRTTTEVQWYTYRLSDLYLERITNQLRSHLDSLCTLPFLICNWIDPDFSQDYFHIRIAHPLYPFHYRLPARTPWNCFPTRAGTPFLLLSALPFKTGRSSSAGRRSLVLRDPPNPTNTTIPPRQLTANFYPNSTDPMIHNRCKSAWWYPPIEMLRNNLFNSNLTPRHHTKLRHNIILANIKKDY